MTTAADDSAVEDAFEALLAGRPAPEGVAGLAAFTEAVRSSATAPGRPNAALAELLATGLLADQSSPSARTARSAGSPPVRRSSRVRIRRRTAMIFPVLLAKFLSAGAVAQAATGATVVVVAVSGAGAVGVLPDPVQDTVASVVETVTPLDLPSTDDAVLPEDLPTVEPVPEDVADPADPAEAEEGTEFDAVAWALEGPEETESFGDWVSQGAGDKAFKAALKAEGLNFGTIVRTWAHSKGLDDGELGAELEAEGIPLDELAEEDTPEQVTTDDAAGTEQTDDADGQVATTERGNRGNGKVDSDRGGRNGNGNGRGNGRN